MPAKGSKLVYGNRDYIYNKSFHERELAPREGFDLPWDVCKDIIENSNKNIAEAVCDEIDGFKLPFGLGYVVAGKYIPTHPLTDWKATKETGSKKVHLNLHTFGYAVKIYWFRVGRIRNTKFHETYKLSPYKTLSSAVSNLFGSGKRQYHEWCTNDFIDKGRLENMYNKKYRKELNN